MFKHSYVMGMKRNHHEYEKRKKIVLDEVKKAREKRNGPKN